MLFSHPDVVRILNDNFECAWESLRPVPKVTIDFGDGRVLKRTLSGNILTSFALADGRVLDVVPGLVDPVEFQRRLGQAERLHTRVRELGAQDPQRVEPFVRAYHADDSWKVDDPQLALLTVAADLRPADVSKAGIEDPIKSGLFALHRERLADQRSYRPAGEGPGDHLLADTAHNREVRYPQVRALLAARPLAPPRAWTDELFRLVLDVDLADPYLGLAPYVLGGEHGREVASGDRR